MEGSNKAKELIDKISDIPLLDESLVGIIPLLEDSNSNFEKIVKELTPSIVAKFLMMANSAYYGVEVKSIDHALRILGYEGMKQILSTSIIIDHFMTDIKGREFDFEKFYEDARVCGYISRFIGEVTACEKKENLFTVSMLHNLGKVIIAAYFNKEYRDILDLVSPGEMTDSDAEKKILGMDHAEIGALVLEKFNVPASVCSAVRNHNCVDCSAIDNEGYELDMIVRESARLTHILPFPECADKVRILERLKSCLAMWKRDYDQCMRTKLMEKGHKDAFFEVLPVLSSMIYDDFRGLLVGSDDERLEKDS